MDGLAGYDAIILSDIGSNTLLLPPPSGCTGDRAEPPSKLIRDWVRTGGGLLMMRRLFQLPGHRRSGPLAPHPRRGGPAGHLPTL